MAKPNVTNDYAIYNPSGQSTAVNSMPVALASDATVTVTQSDVNTNTAALITAVSATTTQTSADQTNSKWVGGILVVDITAIAVTGSVVFTLQGKDAASGKYYTLITSAALMAVSTTVYQIYPASTVAAINYNGPLPTTFRVVVTPLNGVAVSYTVGAALLG